MSLAIDPELLSTLLDGAGVTAGSRDESGREAGEPWQKEYAYSLGLQAYVWGFPWVYLSQLCWLWTSPGGKLVAQSSGMQMPNAPMNTIHNIQAVITPETSDGGSPNCDTLYSTAWLDLSREPLVLSVPAVTNRFYNIELASISSDNFAYVGVVATGNAAGNYLIAGSNWFGVVPDDVMDVLERCPTPVAFMLGRTAAYSGAQEDLMHEDISGAIAVQEGYALTPLSSWGQPERSDARSPRAQVPIGLDIEQPRGTWETMNRAMTQNPPGVYPAIDQTALINLFATIGVGPGQQLAAQTQATLEGLALAANDGLALLKKMSVGRGKSINRWNYPPLDVGRAGQSGDYITRAALQALGGILANDPNQNVYLNTATDSDARPLAAASEYTITFEKDGAGFPPIVAGFYGFWSLTLYDDTYNLVSGSQAYSINSYHQEFSARQANGDMTILLQRDRPDALGNGVYWLQTPAPPADGNDATTAAFTLMLRVYVPGPAISAAQTWAPPKIVRTN
ncbi:MAG: hypothetical protein QOJ39_1176 [Candidatus Eremiobacteraeota bacterium]|jgi:hypothetical protein|nr:hypothetical protein [Candidatus Eremiobacteraeota bacterium]